MLNILIDHDNLSIGVRNKGSLYIVDRILSMLPASLTDTISRAECRFYGGWFIGPHLTKRAQLLGAELAKDFPATMMSRRIPVAAELARSLLIDPSNDLRNTYRERQGAPTVTCRHPVNQGCSVSDCPMAALTVALKENRCPVVACLVRPRELLERNEQKLVDSMMVVDSLFASQTRQQSVALVSSDDDLWPSVHSLLAGGHNIYLVHTEQRTTPYSSVIKRGWGTLWQGAL